MLNEIYHYGGREKLVSSLASMLVFNDLPDPEGLFTAMVLKLVTIAEARILEDAYRQLHIG